MKARKDLIGADLRKSPLYGNKYFLGLHDLSFVASNNLFITPNRLTSRNRPFFSRLV